MESEKLFKRARWVLSIAFLLFTLYTLQLYRAPNAFLVKNTTVQVILLSAVVTSVASIVLSFTRLNIVSIIIALTNIGLLGAFQQTSLSLVYAIPVFLAYYVLERTTIDWLVVYAAASFLSSRMVRAYLIYLTGGYGFGSVMIGQAITSVFECTVFLVVVVPVFRFITKRNVAYKAIIGEKENAAESILKFCSTVSSFHNKYLTEHIKGVRDITQVLLDTLIKSFGYEINKWYYDQILFSVQFHDIGKIYIDPAILDKPGKLTKEEFDEIKKHPTKGLELLALLPKNVLSDGYLHVSKNIIGMHHERMDGTGYPKGLSGDDILFEARLVAVADVADALLSWRPYKPPMSWDKMVEIFKENLPAYDNEVVQALFMNKTKILKISEENNKLLQSLLNLQDQDIERIC